LVNYSGHQDRSFHDPLEIRDIRVELRGIGIPARARSARLGASLPIEPTDGGIAFVLPRLGLFDMVVLEG
jgi:hypothetical protein